MKNKLFALLLLLLVCLFSCQKEKNTTSTYQLSNLSDFAMINNQSIEWVIPVNLKSGTQEKVTVTIGNLPSNVSVLSESTTGYPPFNAKFYITAKYALPSVYTVTINTKNESGQSQEHEVKLTIKPTTQLCEQDFVSLYHNTTSIFNGIVYPEKGYCHAQISYYSENKIKVTCDCRVAYTAYADIFCDQGRFRITSQKVNNHSSQYISGMGSMSPDGTITIDYSIYDAATNKTRNYIDILK